ncbi:hypothetical protein FACS1894189_6160 [Planctomycetales bacterium]|nr:hypothetical protein FACS1894189_6160 [Planctomycetales bacterium]
MSESAESKQDKPKPGNIYDVFVKSFFGRVVVFADFLRHYGNKAFVAEVNLSKIRLAPTHYLGKDGDERIVDLVFQCPLKHGEGVLMAVIVFEHQSGSLDKIPAKLLKYICAIWDAEIKERKPILSAPYFIVLRTGKRPLKGRKPKMADFVTKSKNGTPLGMVPEIDYDVVDLPAQDFSTLAGSTVLRLALGILKKTIEGLEDEFNEAMLPLAEIADEEERVELTKEIIIFVAKVMAVHNRRLDDEKVKKALKPIFHERTKNMIKTIFEEKYDAGVAEGVEKAEAERKPKWIAEGRAEGQALSVQSVLNARFHTVTSKVQRQLSAITDVSRLENLVGQAAVCPTLKDFEKLLGK